MTEPSAAFSRVALPHLDAAFRLALWLMRDRTAAEDVVQEAFVRALTYFASFRGENPRAWLLQIVRTTAMTRLARPAGRCEPLDAAPGGRHAHLADTADDPEAAVLAAERETTLTRAVAALPAELRVCLLLREIEEMSYRDIARITEVPVGTVMSRLFRARQALIGVAREETP